MAEAGDRKHASKGSSDGGTVVMLSGEQLRLLAKLIHYQEVDRIKSIKFSSEKERVQYLGDSRQAYKQAVELMDKADQLQDQLGDHPTTAEVALQYLKHIEMFFSTSLRLVWNLHLRLDMINKIRDHANDILIPQMEDINERFASGTLNPEELEALEAEAKDLVKKLSDFKDFHYQILLNRETPGPRNLSLALKKKGTTFEMLIKEHQLKLVREKGPEYGGLFENLDDAKKIEVYDEIVKSSGKASLLDNKASLLLDGAGIAIILLTVGLTAWDIYSSEHKVQTAVEDGTQLVASIVGSFGGEAMGAAAGAALVGTTVGAETAAAVATAVGVEVTAVSSAFVCLTAVVTGFGAAIALGALTGWLVGMIFHSGGKHAEKVVTVQKPNQPTPPQKTVPGPAQNVVRSYVTPMPNGDILANQIAYQGGPKAQ